MKKILILAFLFFTTALTFSDTLRSAVFNPSANSITLYRQDADGYRYALPVQVTLLSSEQQAAVTAALTWLNGQLTEGETLLSVIIERNGTSLSAAITGKGTRGERTIVVSDADVPEEINTGLLALWDSLEAYEPAE